MIQSDKKLKALASILGSGKEDEIATAVRELREDEPFEGAIALLAKFYDGCSQKALLRIIEDFFNDLRDQSLRPEVIAEIRKSWKPGTISMLVASCWQSGLDYSGYLPDMARTFLKSDYATSIECMTVIESSVDKCSRAVKDDLIAMIMESPYAFMNEKNALVHELLGILNR